LAVGRRQHHGLDGAVGQHLLERRAEREPMLGGEVAHRIRFERHRAGKIERRAEVTRRLHQVLAPPAEADDRGIDHAAAGAPGCLSGWARATASILLHSSTMRLKVGYGAMSTLK